MRKLAHTDLRVSELCLGANVFGWTIDQERSFEVLDAFLDAGGNFIDTADTYGRRGSGGVGESERVIGRWLSARGNRDQVVLASKVGMAPGLQGLSRQTIRRGIEGSLARLEVDHIDLYYAHRDDPSTPLEQTLGVFAELIEEGKVRHVGASNYSAQRLRQALELGGRDGLARFVALQPHYNLLEREYERELEPLCARHGLACLPYYALARGFLSGKYQRAGDEVDSARAAGVLESYCNDRGFEVLDVLSEVAGECRSSLAAVALAWLQSKPTVLAPIASATSTAQLAELMASLRIKLSPDQLMRLDKAHAGQPHGD
jgi:aryl-alcohol dehydrogenase-like predicted oxidoreductase